MLTFQRVKLIIKHNFTKIALNKNFENFVIYIADLNALDLAIVIHFSQIAQIVALQLDKLSIKNFFNYVNFANLFLLDLVIKLLENITFNKNAIELVNNKYPTYRLIYTLSLIKLETLKTYI